MAPAAMAWYPSTVWVRAPMESLMMLIRAGQNNKIFEKLSFRGGTVFIFGKKHQIQNFCDFEKFLTLPHGGRKSEKS